MQNKTIEVTLRFWTNDLTGVPSNYAHAHGMVTVVSDKEKGIRSVQVPFNRMEDIPAKLLKAAKKAGVRFVIA